MEKRTSGFVIQKTTINVTSDHQSLLTMISPSFAISVPRHRRRLSSGELRFSTVIEKQA